MEVCLIYPITLIYKPTTFQPLEFKGMDFAWTDFISLQCLFIKTSSKESMGSFNCVVGLVLKPCLPTTTTT